MHPVPLFVRRNVNICTERPTDGYRPEVILVGYVLCRIHNAIILILAGA